MKDDEFRGLPTRTGIATGHANERQMIDGLRDRLGCETKVRIFPDGSYALLRTRAGMPRFITTKKDDKVAAVARGFMARAIAKGYAAIFDPYTLEIEVKQYTPASLTYAVGWVQAAAYNPRKWRDVWSWDGALLRINGVMANAFYPLRFPVDVKNAIPYIIPWPSEPIYGTKQTNAPVPKRVFGVGPEAVGIAISNSSYAASFPMATLDPTTPRDNRKALVCGPAINSGTHEATLSQLYFTGAFWDSLIGAWQYSTTRVAMLLTPPYLQKTNTAANVDMPYVNLGGAVSSSGNMSTPISLPSTEIGMVGQGEAGSFIPYAQSPGGYPGHYHVNYPWTGTFSSSLPGDVYASYSRVSYSGAASDTQEHGGYALTYAGSNVKLYDTRQEQCREWYASIPVGGHTHDQNISGGTMTGDVDELWWGAAQELKNPDLILNSGDIPGTRGVTAFITALTPDSKTVISGSPKTRDYEEQFGEFSVSFEGGDLVRCEYSRSLSTGQKITPQPITGYYASSLANPYGLIGVSSGMGVYNHVFFTYAWNPGNDVVPIQSIYKVRNGVQDPSATTDINNEYVRVRNIFAAQLMYDNERTSGIYRTHYTATTDNDVTIDTKSLAWNTVDYLLHDKTNEVYITVEGEFSGSQTAPASGAATLTVLLRIKTPLHDQTKTLAEFSLTYGDLLPERELVPGKTYIPSPQIRAIFAPKYREQGAFRGAAYITADEVAQGATPAMLVNFVLALEPYSFIGTDEPTDKEEHFVPCNLLEMLYAYVYSQEYGVHPAFRYPVTNTSTYNAIMADLFLTKHNIEFRDGVFSDWSAGLGAPYGDDHKMEISRV